MGFISLILLLCLSILLYGHGNDNKLKSDSVQGKAYDTLKPYAETMGYFGIIFGLLAIVFNILFSPPYYWGYGWGYGTFFIIRPLANALLVVLALPFGYQKFVGHFKKMKPETKSMLDSRAAAILKNHTILAFIGFATSALMFFSVSRFY